MKIEDVNSNILRDMNDSGLSFLRGRCLNIYDRYFKGTKLQKAVDMERELFLTKYLLIRSEMEARGVRFFQERPLDKEISNRIFKASLWKLDVPALGNIIAVPNYISVSGDFIKSPTTIEKVDVIIRSAEEHRNDAFEEKIAKLINGQTSKEVNFIYNLRGPDSSYIPIFDLVLKSHNETRKVKMKKVKKVKKKEIAIKKPEETENTIRIPVGPECEVTATITIDKGQGITALYCGKIKKIRTYLFDKRVKAWTMTTARAWIKEHTEKINKQLEENLENFEYLIHHVAMEGDEEIVHHCNMYDHIGNLFEQAHLWIDKGKVYLDGKEIKEGHYHVIKGLESKQEVAWSEEEATDAGIKPKGMMSGMTLKEKAKVW